MKRECGPCSSELSSHQRAGQLIVPARRCAYRCQRLWLPRPTRRMKDRVSSWQESCPSEVSVTRRFTSPALRTSCSAARSTCMPTAAAFADKTGSFAARSGATSTASRLPRGNTRCPSAGHGPSHAGSATPGASVGPLDADPSGSCSGASCASSSNCITARVCEASETSAVCWFSACATATAGGKAARITSAAATLPRSCTATPTISRCNCAVSSWIFSIPLPGVAS